MKPNSVGHFEIYADDPQKLAQFYSTLFDWSIEEMPELDYWWIKTAETNEKGMPIQHGAINGGMLKRPDGYDGHAWINYINVDSIESATEKAEKLGAKVMKEKSAVPGMGYFAMFIDPQGNPFAIWHSDKDAK